MSGLTPLFVIFTLCVVLDGQSARQRRQISVEQPRIMTNDGHLIFQTGMNHNISFKSVSGGYINIDGQDIKQLANTVKSNKLAIDQIKSSPTATPNNIETRLTNVEQRLNNLQPTGQVQTQLTDLNNRVRDLTNNVPSNLNSRLHQIDQRFNNLVPTGQVQTTLNDLRSRVTAVENRVTSIESGGSGGTTDIQNRITTLEGQVQELRNLLTQNECNSNPCRNGGTCVDRFNGFFCQCPPAWQGTLCDTDVNECATYAGTDMGCQNGATCVNTQGSFTCQCTANWYGIRCSERHDDCSQASHQELCGHGTCVNSDRVQPGQPKYRCICEDGWTTSGTNPQCIVDRNECTETRSPCSVDPPVTCINVPGTFYCGQCPSGYSGNGFTCVDINECEVNNGGCSLSPRVDCINTRGSRTCGPCPAGYQGNGITCTWVGLCNINNGGCHPQASCQESPGIQGIICTCPPGYVGNGQGPNGCQQQGITDGPCSSNPCFNGAICQNVGNSYNCECQPGYEGSRCQTNTDECASNPCQNGGTCTDRVNGYQCQCTASYTGPQCEEETQACGGVLTQETGTIRYPVEQGTSYPHGVSCSWRIRSTPGKIISATFPVFHLENHPSCAYDYLQIHDGPSATAHKIGTYCGNTLLNTDPVNTTQHQMYLWFYSDSSVSGDGFVVNWISADPVCGGMLSGQDHGTISSPGYPGNYPHNRDCVWIVSVSPGSNIMFTFAVMALEHHSNCSYDYLEIRDGSQETSPLLQRYCSTATPTPITTTNPYAWVKFHSDSSLSDQGFLITFAAVSAGADCGGTLTSSEGVLTSPNFPSPYNHRSECVWTITVAQGDTITLTFTTLDIEYEGSCNFDFVEVRDGPSEMSPLFNRFCGTTLPSPLVSNGNSMFVRFSSDASQSGQGFRATWTTSCGGTFTDPEGTIQSPSFPNAYPGNKDCVYVITQPIGNRVTLTFTDFSVEGSPTCTYDYVIVYDGGNADAEILGRFCGSQVPDPITTSQNMMMVRFVSDGSDHNRGFRATYTSASGGCGGVLTSPTGSLTSPGHPNVYPHGANCTWNIQVSPGLVIRLTFHAFSMEVHANCNYDYVEVYDNSSVIPASLIGRYCGSDAPPTTTSSSNVMTILFVSDSSVSHEGFSAGYVSLNASTVCGSELRDTTGVITSPNYPSNYPHQRECVWTIVAPDGNQILLNITDFQLESHTNCAYDYLEIRNGGFPSSPLVGTYCGTTINRIIRSHSNRLYIKFKTDHSQSARGFRITFDTTSSGCGADLSNPTGSFVSPNYPNQYSHNAECFWTITISRGSQIMLSFVDMSMENHANCLYDYVEVRDNSPTGALLGRFCGNQVPDPVTSISNKLWVKMRTDFSQSGRGFHAFYSSICDTLLTSYSGVIESPNFPNPYPHNRNCTWIIKTTLGNTVNASFSHFDMETHTSCDYDFLQIRDGGTRTSPLIGTYCNSMPNAIASSTEYLWVNFVSDFSVANNGFRMEYITNGCGGYLTTSTGSFTSPNYPNPYPHRRECIWTIEVATGLAIELKIENFDLETHTSCRYDVLEVYGGRDTSAPRLAQICHKQSQPQVLTSTGNHMYVRFKSDSSISGNGFSASYKTLTGGCGGNYSTPSGVLVSKNYPENYPHNTLCEWLITVEEGKSVIFTFQDFDVEGSSDCRYDYVALYDGPNANASEIVKHCGNSLPIPAIYRSNGRQMFVKMRSDGSVAAKGFKAQYKTGCGGIIDGEEDGVITSPNYPENYDIASNCSWLIRADHSDDRITLTFTHMDIEEYNNCAHDYVRVLNGDDENAPEIGTYCGTTVPSSLTSQGSAMFVQFVSDNSIQKSGFRALYTKSLSSCGADFTAQSGSFTTPGYPNSYPHGVECVWTIRVSPGNQIGISFSNFEIEYHPGCNYDYVELREGNVHGRLIGRYCGGNMPGNLTAANGLWVKFRSDESDSGVGFLATYNSLYGGELTGSSGQVASPNYPNQYPHNVDYTWTITVAVGMKIRITFSTMDIEDHSACFFDYVRFLDGPDDDSPEVGKFCGTSTPDDFMSSSNVMRVIFHSDFSSSGQGFLFQWTATNDELPTTTPTPGSTTPVPGCGDYLGASNVANIITSPGYPNGYANRLNCLWRITALPGFRVWLNITNMDIEGHVNCRYDKVIVYDNINGNGRILGQYCGRVGNEVPLLSSSNGMSVRFQTDISVNRTGFSLTYKAGCGGEMRMNQGMISSTNYPNSYPNNENCTWTMIVTVGRTIQVVFNTTYNINGPNGNCQQGDYIQLLNGGYENSPPLGNSADGRYCGSNPPSVMETGSNRLLVKFVSNGAGTSTGFSLTFTEVHVSCGGRIRLTQQVAEDFIMSPNYPSNYPHNVDCEWIITAPATEIVQADFVENFNIETHSRCIYDYIEFHDGGTVNSPVLGRYCGTTRPGTVKSTGNVLYGRFRTDTSVPRIGFKARVSIGRCGGTYVGQSGFVQSPNYPANYDSGVSCEWFIRGPTGHFLTLSYQAFNLENSPNCSAVDYVEIRDVNSTGQLLQRSCGFQVPQSVTTSDSFAYVKFVSNNANAFTGFRLNFEASVEECGGFFTTDTGSFTSPNFPGQYPHSRICTWKIRVQQGRRITLTFDVFNIENVVNCYYDYVAVYNGNLDDSPQIGRYCGTNQPSSVKSSGNTMKVVFRTDGSISNGGFRAHFSSQEEKKCGGIITSMNGNITSPGYATGNYSNSEECIWILSNRNQSSTSIFMSFNIFQLETHGDCIYDFLEIREGNSDAGVLTGKYCGNTTRPEPVFSPTPFVWVRFRTDRSIVDRGFYLNYAFTDCGGVLTDQTGEITSPNFPNNYNHSDACTWLILAPEGSQIQISFRNFSLENHPNCNFDYVDILNGRFPRSPSIGKKCGRTVPESFTSQSNALRVIFKTDWSVSANGFKLIYNFITGGCGGLYHGNTGLIHSPNFPNSYPHNTECVWDINVEEGYHVILNFIPPFDMEAHGDCMYDYVEVDVALRNGSLVNRNRWCENKTPPQQVSYTSRMVVKFRSDAGVNGNGFSANWTTGCGAVFTADEDAFISPGYPNDYGHNLVCNYTIDIDPQRFVVLQFFPVNFHIEGGTNCPHDYVQAYAGNSTSGRVLAPRICGTTVPDAVSSLGSMFLQFVTDRSIAFSGFRAHYKVSDCGGEYTDPYNTIQTPTHPDTYHHNANCSWIITVEENRVVDLRFIAFDLEPHPSCRYDYVDVRDGDQLTSPLIGRYCGKVLPGLQRSTGNTMLVNFVSDYSVAKGGFRATYRTTYGINQGCGGILNSTSGRFTSVDFDGDGRYEHALDCKWTIFVGDNKIVKLVIEGMDIELYRGCRYDYLLVYDGISEDSPLVGKYCGTDPPAPIRSSSNVMHVRFVSDYTIDGAGFNASYSQEDALCGGTLVATENPQTITSPSLPQSSGEISCRWTIDGTEDNQQIRVSVSNLNLLPDNNCSNEYIEFRDVPLGWIGRSIHYCGTLPPPPFDSAGRTMQINYKSVDRSANRGFSLKFQISSCNRTYTGLGGQIYSPGWPGNYEHNMNCMISISAPSGTYVAMYFNSFYIEPHPNCNYDYLEIRNGSSPSSPVISKLCSSSLPNPVFATSNNVWMNFVTDSSRAHPGFDITWTASTQGIGCGGNITGINGSLTSPNYPGNYTERHSCRWLIKAPSRRILTVTFTDLNMIGSSDCNRGHVEVFNGLSETSPTFGRYCGNTSPPPLRASGNHVFVKFISDGLHSAPGFRLKFQS